MTEMDNKTYDNRMQQFIEYGMCALWCKNTPIYGGYHFMLLYHKNKNWEISLRLNFFVLFSIHRWMKIVRLYVFEERKGCEFFKAD